MLSSPARFVNHHRPLPTVAARRPPPTMASPSSVAATANALMHNLDAKLAAMTPDEMAEFLAAASAAYYNTSVSVISDDIYDIVKTELAQRAPKHPFLAEIGAPAPAAAAALGGKIKLPHYMGSLDKIREDPKALVRFVAKYSGDYVAMDKLDGNSALVVYDASGRATGMYSRGDGTTGQNLAHLLPLIGPKAGLPVVTAGPLAGRAFAVRGELIISRADWAKISDLGANARNVVAGAMHTRTPNPKIAAAIRFVAYDLLEPHDLAIGEALAVLRAAGFIAVHATDPPLAAADMTMDRLSELLLARRAQSEYECDGIVVAHNAPHARQKPGKNPAHAFAFKSLLTHEEAEVVVRSVAWNVSKDGYLKPTVHFNPVVLAGAKLQKATGFNAAFIEKNVIGTGSRIVIIRSGDVIPKIQRVLSPAANGLPALPDGIGSAYAWNETHVDLRIAPAAAPGAPGASGSAAPASAAVNDELAAKLLENFATSLEIPYVAAGTVKKLYAAGVKTIAQFIRLTADEVAKMDGFQKVSAERVAIAIRERLASATCNDLMVASNAFGRGFGQRKIALITGAFPNLPASAPTLAELKAINGLGDKTAQEFLKNLPAFMSFLKETGLVCHKPAAPGAAGPGASAVAAAAAAPVRAAELAGKSVVFTGFRNKDWEAALAAAGAKLSTSVSGKTFIVVAADPDEDSGKLKKAADLGVRVVSRDAFAAEYGL